MCFYFTISHSDFLVGGKVERTANFKLVTRGCRPGGSTYPEPRCGEGRLSITGIVYHRDWVFYPDPLRKKKFRGGEGLIMFYSRRIERAFFYLLLMHGGRSVREGKTREAGKRGYGASIIYS